MIEFKNWDQLSRYYYNDVPRRQVQLDFTKWSEYWINIGTYSEKKSIPDVKMQCEIINTRVMLLSYDKTF